MPARGRCAPSMDWLCCWNPHWHYIVRSWRSVADDTWLSWAPHLFLMTPRSRIQSGVSWEAIINDSSGKVTGMCAFPYQ